MGVVIHMQYESIYYISIWMYVDNEPIISVFLYWPKMASKQNGKKMIQTFKQILLS